ncbi:inositol monophosphatase [Enterococcus avium]|uniref:inositol monophosphatase family protein n=1 Tax=Enterococcus malodoratus TaxID=71451 RepID=UPI0008B3A275|nr:inositol monophosphatase family protein [Enterococcus malodoratus]BBM18079.1 inositol monophosphatase [Enterococcus avium]SET02761.1 myo-inositol-1(or 4)-monophosphatase [Enterococcus malodoratus]
MEKEIIGWIYEAAEKVKSGLGDALKVDQKNGRTDLVTNVDKEVQDFIVKKIHDYDPEALILGEENGQDDTPIDKGRVFVIDPIDGTLNFVMQQENFCIMIAVYEEGVGQLGFIYDVMRDELLWGGPKVGKVYNNKEELSAPENKSLSEGLIGMNAALYRKDLFHAQEIGQTSMGIRVLGCAGLDFVAILKGTQIGYVSMLSPWDYAAGTIMMEQLGMTVIGENQQPLSFKGREFFIGATQAAMAEIQAISKANH